MQGNLGLLGGEAGSLPTLPNAYPRGSLWRVLVTRSPQRVTPTSLLCRLPARLPLARVVISRGERKFAGAILSPDPRHPDYCPPRLHFDRDDHRGSHSGRGTFDGRAQLERGTCRSAIARIFG
jgi:hypothetical protein